MGSDAMPHILIVEDEAAIADTLIYALQGEGFTTTWLSLAPRRWSISARPGRPDHPRHRPAGHQRLRNLQAAAPLQRSAGDVPQRPGRRDRPGGGPGIGADDYVVKPFSPREVAARAGDPQAHGAASAVEASSTLFRIDPSACRSSIAASR
jgi:two-component system catabolic regulation response regulator CreB